MNTRSQCAGKEEDGIIGHVTDANRYIHDETCYYQGWPGGSTTINRAGGNVRRENVGDQLADMVEAESHLRGVGRKNQPTWSGCKMIVPPMLKPPEESMNTCSVGPLKGITGNGDGNYDDR